MRFLALCLFESLNVSRWRRKLKSSNVLGDRHKLKTVIINTGHLGGGKKALTLVNGKLGETSKGTALERNDLSQTPL